jgi:hypothetical protein
MSDIDNQVEPSDNIAEANGGQLGLPAQTTGANSTQVQQPPALEFERMQLISRFLLGIGLLGGEQFLRILRDMQRDIDATPALTEVTLIPGTHTSSEIMRYLGIGLFVRGQKRIARGIRWGVQTSLSTAGRALNRLNRAADNQLTRPVRRPLESQAESLAKQLRPIIEEGRFEERNARLLAGETVSEIIDEVLDFVANNPDLQDFITDLIGQQSGSLAGVVGDNARQVAVVGDNLSERIVRGLFRRKPRRDMPPSPFLGQPQTMYQLEMEELQGEDDHDQ